MYFSKEAICVIIGASHGGANLAFSLRKEGWLGHIKLIDIDPELPYHRPPLSKGFLSTDGGIGNFLLKPASAYEKENIELHLGKKVVSIDKNQKTVKLDDDLEIKYDKLVLSTGARPFVPPIAGLDSARNVNFLRTAADVFKIKEAFQSCVSKNILIIGGGYIGLEIAASLRKLGGNVTLLEREERILARVTAPEMSIFFHDLHTQNGVAIFTQKQVESVNQSDGINSVICSDGSTFDSEMIILGVGIRVNTELAENIGLTIENGIKGDETGRTSDPNIYAIGDCSFHYNPHYGRFVRLESVQNAVDQGKVAAASICGKETKYETIPWFWSDQYDIKLQMVGLSTGYNEVILRKEEEYKLSAWYFKDEELLAVDSVNNAKAYVLGTKILKEKGLVIKEVLQDISKPLSINSLLNSE